MARTETGCEVTNTVKRSTLSTELPPGGDGAVAARPLPCSTPTPAAADDDADHSVRGECFTKNPPPLFSKWTSTVAATPAKRRKDTGKGWHTYVCLVLRLFSIEVGRYVGLNDYLLD